MCWSGLILFCWSTGQGSFIGKGHYSKGFWVLLNLLNWASPQPNFSKTKILQYFMSMKFFLWIKKGSWRLYKEKTLMKDFCYENNIIIHISRVNYKIHTYITCFPHIDVVVNCSISELKTMFVEYQDGWIREIVNETLLLWKCYYWILQEYIKIADTNF